MNVSEQSSVHWRFGYFTFNDIGIIARTASFLGQNTSAFNSLATNRIQVFIMDEHEPRETPNKLARNLCGSAKQSFISTSTNFDLTGKSLQSRTVIENFRQKKYETILPWNVTKWDGTIPQI